MGGGWFQVVWTQVSTVLGNFVTLRLIRGCALGLLEASVLGGKMSSPYGKVRRSANTWLISQLSQLLQVSSRSASFLCVDQLHSFRSAINISQVDQPVDQPFHVVSQISSAISSAQLIQPTRAPCITTNAIVVCSAFVQAYPTQMQYSLACLPRSFFLTLPHTTVWLH